VYNISFVHELLYTVLSIHFIILFHEHGSADQ